MTGAQIAVSVLTGVVILGGATLIGLAEGGTATVMGIIIVAVGLLGYFLLLAMIASDRR